MEVSEIMNKNLKEAEEELREMEKRIGYGKPARPVELNCISPSCRFDIPGGDEWRKSEVTDKK